MPDIRVTVEGAEEAVLLWDSRQRTLTRVGRRWTATFLAASGRHYYRIKVEGHPGDPWTAKIEDAASSRDHAGHLNANRRDQTGKRRFDVA